MVNLADFGGPQFNPNEPGPGGHGQQGTLFSNRRLNAANRTGDEVGHKGYSPNRLAEVRSAVDVTLRASGMTIPINRALNGAHNAAWDRGEYPDSPEQLNRRRDIAVGMTTRSVHENIARSTVPGETLRRQMPSGREKGTDITIDHLQGQAGTYSPLGGNITLDPSHIDGVTPIHELGHQQDWHAQALANASRTAADPPEPGVRSGAAVVQLAGQHTPENMATVEGFADAFADHHTRAHPKAPPSKYNDDESGYGLYSEQDWHDYADPGNGHEDDEPHESAWGAPQAYADARALHGGRNLNRVAEHVQQLQFGRHAEVDPADESWSRALSGR